MGSRKVLSFERRLDFGSSNARRIRSKSEIPAIIYGNRNNIEHIKIKNSEFSKKFAKFTDNTVLILNDGKSERCVFIKDVDENITRKFIYHVDFYEVDKNVEIEKYVSIKFTGASIGVKEGGVLTIFKTKIKIKSLPLDLPEFIEVDLTSIKKGDEIKFKDIKIPLSVKLIEDDENLVVFFVK